MKSDEKASLALRNAGERAPSRSRKSARPAHLLRTQNLLAASAKSHRKLQNVRKVRTVLWGGFEHQTQREKPRCSRSIRPRNSHYSDWVSNTEDGFAESARSGKDGAAPTFYCRGEIDERCASVWCRIGPASLGTGQNHAESRPEALASPREFARVAGGPSIRQNARVSDQWHLLEEPGLLAPGGLTAPGERALGARAQPLV